MGPNSATTPDLLSLLHVPKCSLPPPHHHPSSMLPNSSFSLERERRVHLNNRYMALKSLIPNPTKEDRASIVGEAIDYIKELLRTIEEFTRLLEKKRLGRFRSKKKARAGEGRDDQGKEEEDAVNYKPQSEVDQSWLKRKSKVTEVGVRIIDDEVTIKLVQKKKINCLLFTTKVLDQLQLDLQHVSGGQNGDHYSFLFSTKICEGSCVYASGVADTVMEVVEKQYMEAVPSNGERRKKNESPGERGDSSLHISARTGNLGKVKELIRGCGNGGGEELLSKQNLEGETPLYSAAENGHSIVVEEMLKHMDLETASIAARNGFDPFQVAAKKGHLEVLKILLEASPNLAMTTDLSCATALHTAATQGHIDVVNLLLETDSKLDKISKNNGKTALHSAARMGHVEVVKSLIGNDPSIGFRTDKNGQTALHMAVKRQNDGIVVELVRPDVAVLSIEDSKGNTPLHIATNKGRIKIVRCLVSFEGVNPNPINKAGDTPLDIAEKMRNAELLLVLKEAGAATAKDLGKPQNPAKQLKQTVNDIKHEVKSQLQQSRQTGARVQEIAKILKKLHVSGLDKPINSATVVAVLIATVAFSAIFTISGQYKEYRSKGKLPGQDHIANKAPFLVFFIFDSLALFISLAVVVVQTSVVVIEQKAKKKLVFVINKLMMCACLFISIAFVSLSYIVVGEKEMWLHSSSAPKM